MRQSETIVKYYASDEIYTDLYNCKKCDAPYIFKEFKFCPMCGRKIIAREVKVER